MMSVKIEPGTVKIEPGLRLPEIKLEHSPKNFQGNSKKRKNKPYKGSEEVNFLRNKLNCLENRLKTTRLMFLNALHNRGFQGNQNNNFPPQQHNVYQGGFTGNPNYSHSGYHSEQNNVYRGYHHNYNGNGNQGYRHRNNARQYTKSDLNNLKQEIVFEIKQELKNELIKEIGQTLKQMDPEEDIIASSLFIGIWDKNPITEERLVELKRSIIVKIMQETVNGVGPRFKSYKFRAGWLQVICKDLKSLEWMHNTIPSLKPWYDADLTIKTCEELEKSNKIILSAPSSEANSPNEAVSLLKKQNPGLDIDKWEMIHVVYQTDTFLVHFNVSDGSIEELRNLNFKPFFGFKRAHVELQTNPTDISILSQDVVMIDSNISVIEVSD